MQMGQGWVLKLGLLLCPLKCEHGHMSPAAPGRVGFGSGQGSRVQRPASEGGGRGTGVQA